MDDLDRRPIAARRLRPVILLVDRLVAWRVSPDAISLAGLGCGLLAGASFACVAWRPAPGWWLLGAALVGLRLLANMLDGMVAVGRGVASRIGELYNEAPDRVSDTAVLIGVGVAGGSVAWGCAAALAAMATAYVRAVGKSMGVPGLFGGPMAKQQRMAVVVALSVWCAVGPAGMWPLIALAAITVLAAVTAGRRLLQITRALS